MTSGLDVALAHGFYEVNKLFSFINIDAGFFVGNALHAKFSRFCIR